ncbi:MAG TPA: NUDIX hydrolase [Candidatus Marinimicrobia bacterium]|nr:NUDIX hydrolase [Candidatus Neomarinimicrobiota bacterium]
MTLTETKIDSQTVFRGRLLHVCKDRVRLPNGKETTREFIIHPGAVVVLPFLDDKTLIFERQFRYPAGKIFIELPAGKIDPGEEIAATGRRELLEETGYIAESWDYLGKSFPGIGYTNEVIHIYIAKNLRLLKQSCDADEFLEIFSCTLEEALAMLDRGEIVDAKTQVALLLAERKLRKT